MTEQSRILTASSPEHLLVERIALQERQMVHDCLAPYEPISATYAWLDTLRAIEECINLINVDWDDDEFEEYIYSLPLSLHVELTPQFQAVRQLFIKKFSRNFANRFTNLIRYGVGIATGFDAHGHSEIASYFRTVGSMIIYLQSRRRHFIALLHMIPKACCGNKAVIPYDALLIFLPMIELNGVQLKGAQNALKVKLSRTKLGLPAQESAELAMLDPFFLEPERAPIINMPITDDVTQWAMRETLSPDRIFSAAELRNDILNIEIAYSEFELAKTEFPSAAGIVRRLSINFVEKDFWIVVSPEDISALFDEFRAPPDLKSAFLSSGVTYLDCLSTYSPFVLINGVYRSTVTLLSRFIYYWRARCLDRQKRYQIRTGFIFEEAVRQEISRQGFVVQDVRRINRREFDVVTVRDGVIWNIQCKNNFTDIDYLEADASRFARFNYRLVRAYESALLKEKNREHLLKEKLALNEVQHMVVSRFPVVSDNPRFVPYSRIKMFGEIANDVISHNQKGVVS
ncbi:hypothetical protein [Azospirillum cavernae]|uniref:hypothetical protein n=1 Tax=Azospirillum cavernae TaxID=2320860 RepID=UPI0011C379F2|nr:hypothetical protein [Azospirillum cavernae]